MTIKIHNNELWRYGTGYLAGYTEDKDLIRRIKRYKDKRNWRVIAEYFDTKNRGRLIGVQFRIPIEQRRPAERMFGVSVMNE